jgi:hypothetical protein
MPRPRSKRPEFSRPPSSLERDATGIPCGRTPSRQAGRRSFPGSFEKGRRELFRFSTLSEHHIRYFFKREDFSTFLISSNHRRPAHRRWLQGQKPIAAHVRDSLSGQATFRVERRGCANFSHPPAARRTGQSDPIRSLPKQVAATASTRRARPSAPCRALTWGRAPGIPHPLRRQFHKASGTFVPKRSTMRLGGHRRQYGATA